jgi:15-cis-phytoene synthase
MLALAEPVNRAQLVAKAGRRIRHGSRSFHAASRLFDGETRERTWLLYSWCRHCDDVCDGQELGHRRPLDDKVAEDIEDLTRRILEGETVGLEPYQALAVVLAECAIPHRFVTDHLDGFALDARGWRPRDERDLIAYCYHVAGAVGCMMAVVMGVHPDDEQTLAGASALGIAFQLSNIARDICEDEEAGRCYIPETWLREHDIDLTGGFAGQKDKLAAISARLLELADRHERDARSSIPALPFRARWAVLAAAGIYGEIGRRVAALGPAAWERRVSIGRSAKFCFLLTSFAEALKTRKG